MSDLLLWRFEDKDAGGLPALGRAGAEIVKDLRSKIPNDLTLAAIDRRWRELG